MTKKLKSLLPEGRRSGPKEEFFWSLLRNQSEKIEKDRDLLSSENFEQIEAAKKNLLRFEAIRPFVEENFLLLNKYISIPREECSKVPQWGEALERLKQRVNIKLESLDQEKSKTEIWPEQKKNEYLEWRKQLLSEAGSSQFFFNETIDQVVGGSLIALCAAALAYELYLDSLPVSSQGASS